MTYRLLTGDCRELLPTLDAGSVQCVVTSPPYWGLRDYGVEAQIGQERTVDAYVETLVEVFRAVRRVLRDDGTVWLNLGDSYAGSWGAQSRSAPVEGISNVQIQAHSRRTGTGSTTRTGLPAKNLVGIPWRVAFALQADGWILRSDIVWAKPNPMPESVTDRPTRAHEYVFLLTKSARYFYDADAIREPAVRPDWKHERVTTPGNPDRNDGGCTQRLPKRRTDKPRGHGRRHAGFNDRWDSLTKAEQQATGANKRSVWTIATRAFPGAHFATFPPALVEPCILAGSRRQDTVLDPFVGSGTTGAVACGLGRQFIGIELNVDYAAMATARISEAHERYQGGPLFFEREQEHTPQLKGWN